MQIRSILPIHADDPANQFPNIRGANRQLDNRFGRVQKELNALIRSLKNERTQDAVNTYRQPTKLEQSERDRWDKYKPVLQVNEYIYELDAQRYRQIDDFIERLLYGELLDSEAGNFTNRFWLTTNLEKAYSDSLEDIAKELNISSNAEELSEQAALQMRQVTAESMLFSPPVQRRLGLVYARVFNQMKGLSDSSKSDLAETLTRAMADGVGIPEITKRIKGRLNVSYSRARRIARTEILNAFRSATTDETRVINEELTQDEPVKFNLLWISALAPTTRPNHRAQHGKIRTREWVKDFYSKDANQINCLCAQRPILVNKKTGEPVAQKALVKRLRDQVKG